MENSGKIRVLRIFRLKNSSPSKWSIKCEDDIDIIVSFRAGVFSIHWKNNSSKNFSILLKGKNESTMGSEEMLKLVREYLSEDLENLENLEVEDFLY